MRKMATVKVIDEIVQIPDADAIEAAKIGGWTVVVKKGEYKAGDKVIYCEIDSWIPYELAPFLSKGKEPRVYNGVKGERLKTAKLRGQLSQGLVLPMCVEAEVGSDVSELLNIQKWEAPLPVELAGQVNGPFPSFLVKTDQERIQNLTVELEQWKKECFEWEVTEKLDGSSISIWNNGEKSGVCSRNWDLTESETNSYWSAARKSGIIDFLKKEGNYAVQGELIGEGIQGNPYKISGREIYIFDVYDIDNKRYLSPEERLDFLPVSFKHVPNFGFLVISEDKSVESILSAAEDKSLLNAATEREGLVFKRSDGRASFKAISNKFLLRQG